MAFFWFPLHASIAQKEKVELEHYFQTLFIRSEIPYTLFGDKPMSFFSYFVRPPKEFIIQTPIDEPQLKNWHRIYEKYKHLFNSEHFLLLDQAFYSSKFPTSSQVRDVILINKNAFLKAIDRHLGIFKKRLGDHTTADLLLSQIEQGKAVLTDVLQEDELLWGLLLGYGEHNATLYSKREQLECEILLDLKQKNELDFINNQLTGFASSPTLSRIPLPLFLCDPIHPETIKLSEHYSHIQEKVNEILNDPNFCDLILDRFNS